MRQIFPQLILLLVIAAVGTGLVAWAGAEPRGSNANPAADAGHYVRVEVLGRLATGVIAIGAETTGTTITAGRVTWELDLQDNRELQQTAEELSGKDALVTGTLERRPGVEIRDRWIVTVETLRRPEAPAEEQD